MSTTMLMMMKARATTMTTPEPGSPRCLNALQNRSTHAGEVEDDLDDDGAAHKVTDLKTEGGDRGDQRVAQNVDADDDLLGNAGATGHADVVLVELLNHGGTHDTSHLARQRECQSDSGHDHTVPE